MSRSKLPEGFPAMTGTQSQIEWAELIKLKVSTEFDRTAQAFEMVASRQDPASAAHTRAVIAVLELKKQEVLANPSAGYFCREWWELAGQVRTMLFNDPRYQTLQAGRHAV